jgi:hypothetical protein
LPPSVLQLAISGALGSALRRARAGSREICVAA